MGALGQGRNAALLAAATDPRDHDLWDFGCALACVGDVDGDGRDDLAVGQVSFGAGGNGAVQIVSGADGRRIVRWMESDLGLSMQGP